MILKSPTLIKANNYNVKNNGITIKKNSEKDSFNITTIPLTYKEETRMHKSSNSVITNLFMTNKNNTNNTNNTNNIKNPSYGNFNPTQTETPTHHRNILSASHSKESISKRIKVSTNSCFNNKKIHLGKNKDKLILKTKLKELKDHSNKDIQNYLLSSQNIDRITNETNYLLNYRSKLNSEANLNSQNLFKVKEKVIEQNIHKLNKFNKYEKERELKREQQNEVENTYVLQEKISNNIDTLIKNLGQKR